MFSLQMLFFFVHCNRNGAQLELTASPAPGIKLQIIFITLSDAFVIDSIFWLDFLCCLSNLSYIHESWISYDCSFIPYFIFVYMKCGKCLQMTCSVFFAHVICLLVLKFVEYSEDCAAGTVYLPGIVRL